VRNEARQVPLIKQTVRPDDSHRSDGTRGAPITRIEYTAASIFFRLQAEHP
jgi:hypothetical protein